MLITHPPLLTTVKKELFVCLFGWLLRCLSAPCRCVPSRPVPSHRHTTLCCVSSLFVPLILSSSGIVLSCLVLLPLHCIAPPHASWHAMPTFFCFCLIVVLSCCISLSRHCSVLSTLSSRHHCIAAIMASNTPSNTYIVIWHGGIYFWCTKPQHNLCEVPPPTINSNKLDLLLDKRKHHDPHINVEYADSDWAICCQSYTGVCIFLAGAREAS